MKRPEKQGAKKAYPVITYLIGLFVTVVALVLLSYLVQLRNRPEISQAKAPQSSSILSAAYAELNEDLW